MTNRYEAFADWLNKQMDKRVWKQADLVRAAKINSGLLSMILSGQRRVGVETARSIAAALELPETEVLIQAGLMSRPAGWNAEVEELAEMFAALNPDEREEILAMARLKFHRHRKGKNNAAGRQTVG